MVAADQLESAVEIVARPIPQDVIDECSEEAPEFEPPSCPKCGAGDPVLEGVDPVNSWRCEACGNQWTETVGTADAAAPSKK
jgi:transposase-like protein